MFEKMKKGLCALLTASVVLSSSVYAAETAEVSPQKADSADTEEAADTAGSYFHDGKLTFLDGSCTQAPVTSMEEAAEVVDMMKDRLGGDDRTEFTSWRTIDDAFGNRFFVFQQMQGDTTVLGGAVKVITDSEGQMIGLSSSVVSDLPEGEASEGITGAQAEKVVLREAFEKDHAELNLISGGTSMMILPVLISVDAIQQEEENSRYVWVVYSDNPYSSQDRSSDLPYLAHYVTMDGEYLYSLPTIMPGDEAGAAGFDSAYVFEFMEPAEYTGYVDLSDGTEKEISVTLMRDKRTGMYYLGNIERKIVVGDCFEFLYNGGQVVLESSTDNLAWEQTALLSLYNYCKAWDYYKAIGWAGGDGLETPILILNNYCNDKHLSVNNAAYAGKYLGWQIFLASRANDLSQCLDVLSHEFTHCVTHSVMTYNSYANDYGAINEAISDIQGQLCEMINNDTEDTTWLLGDKSQNPVRSMSDPHSFGQPEFSWDLYYKAKVHIPTLINDEGGVHTNSSLLNRLAYLLCEEGGMTYEEARAFWFTVDCSMVPGTDYAQLAELLPWALKVCGLEQYDAVLKNAIETVRLGDDTIPEVLDADRELLTLTLPEGEIYSDGNWSLSVSSVDVEKLVGNVSSLISAWKEEDFSDMPQSFQDWIKYEKEAEEARKLAKAEEKNEGGLLALAGDILKNIAAGKEPEPTYADEHPEVLEDLLVWAKDFLSSFFYSSNASTGQDGRTITMICRPGWIIPTLTHGNVDEMSLEMDQYVMAFYLGSRWFAMPQVFPEQIAASRGKGEPEKTEEMKEEMAEQKKETDALVSDILDHVRNSFSEADSLEELPTILVCRLEGGGVSELSSDGLTEIKIPEKGENVIPLLEASDIPKVMSRPKTEAETEEAA